MSNYLVSPTRSSSRSTGAPTVVELIDASRVHGSGDARVIALDRVSLAIPSGVFCAVMGPSGSGKSTLLQCAAGLDVVSSGSVRLDGVALEALCEDERTVLRRERVGFVFQSFNLIPSLSAEANIVLPLTLAGRRADPARLEMVARSVGVVDRLGHRPTEMSGGQQQRVAIARALIADPAIIFADEPTGSLDSKAASDVLALLRGVVDEFGRTVVMVTHDVSAAGWADVVVTMSDGRVVDVSGAVPVSGWEVA